MLDLSELKNAINNLVKGTQMSIQENVAKIKELKNAIVESNDNLVNLGMMLYKAGEQVDVVAEQNGNAFDKLVIDDIADIDDDFPHDADDEFVESELVDDDDENENED